jgi:hypothetical protein
MNFSELLIEEKINDINFDLYYKSYLEDKDFYGNCGNEHYRLLSYLSTLFNNSNIMDIGTHRGLSAFALSFNKSNTIHTFDILKKVSNNNILNRENIKFYINDLFNENEFNNFKELILSCPFIFLDVDLHNGVMEIDFFRLLKSINYNGFVICDDIWHFKDMRDKFWYKIDYEQRYDITRLGHWSGTGIINFNKDNIFFKYDNSDWTLVTAYFNLTKCPDASDEIRARSQEYYLNSSFSTLGLPYNLVIYCDKDSYDLIKVKRPEYLTNKTRYIICEFDDFCFKKDGNNFGYYRDKINENRVINKYQFDKRNTASYYLFCMARYIMLKEIINNNPFNTNYFGWINFCIERMGYKNLIALDEALSIKREKFSTCYIDYIPKELIDNTKEYFKYGRCSMCSGFFTGNKYYMYKVCDLIEKKFLEYVEMGYGHADEQLYSPVYFENKELFNQYFGDYQQMITNYVYIYDNINAPINNFIKNSYNNKDYNLCYKACCVLLKSLSMNKVNISDDYMDKLVFYYKNSKKCCN